MKFYHVEIREHGSNTVHEFENARASCMRVAIARAVAVYYREQRAVGIRGERPLIIRAERVAARPHSTPGHREVQA